MKVFAFLSVIVWVLLATSSNPAWGIVWSPVMVVALWKVRAFDPKMQSWLDRIMGGEQK